MANNANKLMGFRPVGLLGASNYDGRGRVYAIPAANVNALYVGDPVSAIAGADATYLLPCIDKGAIGGTCVGVILALSKQPQGLGPWVDPTNLNNIPFRPAGAQANQWYALVADDPNIIFEGQEQAAGGAGVNFGAAAASKNANFNFGAPGAPGYLSQAFIDNGTAAATTATYNVRLLGLAQSPSNAPGAYQKWWFLINNHQYRAGSAGI